MKKILVISLLSVVVFSQFGYYAYFVVQQYCLKQQMKEYVLSHTAKNELIQIDVAANEKDIVWEDDKEFTLGGKMYDVVSKEIVNGKQIAYCVDDKKETILIEKYNKEHKKNKDSKTSNVQFSIVFCEAIPAFSFPKFTHTKPKVFFTSNLFLAEKKADSPPPKSGNVI